jgi:hypothetical protein
MTRYRVTADTDPPISNSLSGLVSNFLISRESFLKGYSHRRKWI